MWMVLRQKGHLFLNKMKVGFGSYILCLRSPVGILVRAGAKLGPGGTCTRETVNTVSWYCYKDQISVDYLGVL